MNRPDKLSQKTHRTVLVVGIFTLVVAGIALGVFSSRINNDTSRSSMTGTNIQPTANGQSTQKTPTPDPEAPLATGTVITAESSEFGTMLFDEKKQAIYIWELEDSEKPKCYDDCAKAWPPVLTNGHPQATSSVDSRLLGTVKRTDGTTQVTYGGHPLYYYAHEGPGEVKCHNVRTHGGLWWVVQPNGNRAP